MVLHEFPLDEGGRLINMKVASLLNPSPRSKGPWSRQALRRLVSTAGAALVFWVAACGSTSTAPSATGTPTAPATAAPTATPTPTPTPTSTPAPVAVIGPGAADPITAVDDAVGGSTGCTLTLIAQPCPMTLRLATRIESNPFTGTGGGAAWRCRCQNQTGTSTFALISQSGTTAYVSESIPGGSTSISLRWTVLEIAGAWIVDDQDTGCVATSIYSTAYDHDAIASPAPTC
jgi:hypothetical protein